MENADNNTVRNDQPSVLSCNRGEWKLRISFYFQMEVNSTENYTVFKNIYIKQCDYAKMTPCVCVCAGLLMNCQSAGEILPSVIVSPALRRGFKPTHIKIGLITLQNITNLNSMYFFYLPLLLSHFLFGHFVTFCSTVILLSSLYLCLSPSHFPSLSSPGVCLSFLGSFFFFLSPHILRKLSLFLLSSVDSPLTVMKQHRGISEEEEGLKTPLSSLCLIYWGIKEKMESKGSLEMNTSRMTACVACGKLTTADNTKAAKG